MPWIESHTVLLRHRKLLQLSAALSLDPVTTMGHLHALWHTVLEQQEDGDLTEWPDELIARAAAYKGDPSLFVRELQSKKWLDGKIVHDWMDYAGRYLTNKYRTSNPRRLNAILRLHQVRRKSVSSPSKVRPKSDKITVPDLTLPNQENQEQEHARADTWGEFGHVQLTPDQHRTLTQRLGVDRVEQLLTELDGAIEANRGYDRRYKSHYAVILNWARRREKRQPKAGVEGYDV